jgi:hypothetical protein
VALELLELLATVNILQPDRLVTRPTDELRWIRRVEIDGRDEIAVALQAQNFRSCLCADEMDAPI